MEAAPSTLRSLLSLQSQRANMELLITVSEAVTLQLYLKAVPLRKWIKLVVMERSAQIQAVSQ